MKDKLVKIARNKQFLFMLAAIVIALIAINPNPWREGLEVKSVLKDSPADIIGISHGEAIIAVDENRVSTLEDFARLTSELKADDTVLVETDKRIYKISLPNDTDLGITVAKRPKTNINTGLDLQGGTRILLQPEERISDEDLDILLANMNRRLNLFGLSDVTVRDASDFGGQQFIMVEIAAVNEDEIKDLISRQGKFEAKIANQSVFRGTDIRDVCRSAECSGIDFRSGGCQQLAAAEWVCPFFFSISLSQEAAQKQADVTRNIPSANGYLTEQLFFYLDDELVNELNIAESLKGHPAVSVQITGSGEGSTHNLASKNAISEMKQMQTILITGSLPTRLDIVRTDTVSPMLGESFVKNALITGGAAIIVIMLMLLLAYRNLLIAIPIMLISLIELFLLLGVAAIIGWSIDLAAIAGIIAAVGTGVNDQIIITDEAFRGELKRVRSWQEKLKSAFSVILGAYFTLLFAMIPLFVIGAGMLRGFAVTTVIGITVGVVITRPAYARIIEILTEK